MARKKLTTLLQVRIDDADKSRITKTAEHLRLSESTVARLSLREGLERIRHKLSPSIEPISK